MSKDDFADVAKGVKTVLIKNWENSKIGAVFNAAEKTGSEKAFGLVTTPLAEISSGVIGRSISLRDERTNEDKICLAVTLDAQGICTVTSQPASVQPNECLTIINTWLKQAQEISGVDWLAKVQRAQQAAAARPNPKPV